MIEQILTQLTFALEKSAAIAIAASFLWGIASVLLSPCHISSIPLIVGFIGMQGDKAGVKKAFLTSLIFSAGILISIGLLGLITGLMGMMLGDTGIWGNILLAIVFILFGLYLMGVLPLSFLDSAARPGYNKKGYWAAFLFGLIFGIGLGPCTFAFMAPVLAVAFTVGSRNIVYSASLVTAYAAGHCALIILAGTFTEAVEKYLQWSEDSKAVMLLKKACGAIMLLAAGYLIFKIL